MSATALSLAAIAANANNPYNSHPVVALVTALVVVFLIGLLIYMIWESFK